MYLETHPPLTVALRQVIGQAETNVHEDTPTSDSGIKTGDRPSETNVHEDTPTSDSGLKTGDRPG